MSSSKLSLYYDSNVCVTYPGSDEIINNYTKNTLFLFLDRWIYSINILPGVSDAAKFRCVKNTVLKRRIFFSLRAQGFFGFNEYLTFRKLIKEVGLNVWAILAILTPAFICKSIFSVGRLMAGR
ncbi:hypothetical protein D3C78_1139260 [compost metagenome]